MGCTGTTPSAVRLAHRSQARSAAGPWLPSYRGTYDVWTHRDGRGKVELPRASLQTALGGWSPWRQSPCRDGPGGEAHGRQERRRSGSRRKGIGGRPARGCTQRGAGRPQWLREDDAGRGARPGDRGGEPRRARGRRRDRLRPRRDRAPSATLGTALAGTGGVGRNQDQSTGHPRVRRLRGGTQGRSAGSGRGPLRRLGGRRRRRRHPDGLGGVRGGRHAACGRRHAPGGGTGRLRGDDRDVP